MVESDLGDIIYILAIVVFGIIGALSKGKKKRGSTMPQSETKPSFWEELTREMKGGNNVEELVEEYYDDEPEEQVVVPDRSQPIVSSPLERMDSYTFNEDRLKKESIEYSADKEARPINIARAKSLKKMNTLKLNLNNIDELKKGIIYAEIFNRKYN